MSALTDLINRLQRGIDKKSAFISTIKHPRLLIASLKELSEVIGHEKLKNAIGSQISHMIVTKRRALENKNVKDDQIMLNTILSGFPGTSKTMCGTILGKIYYALGYIKGARTPPNTKQGIGNKIKGALGQNDPTTSNDDGLALAIILVFIIILITFCSIAWSFYEKFGGIWTIAAIIFVIIIIIIFAIIIFSSLNDSDSTPTSSSNISKDIPPLEKNDNDSSPESNIVRVVSRDDFVGQYVGWTAPKTLKLLNESLGKVLFVDEAYSLINGPQDQFGMEALTTLNLFMSQHPNEIIVIFAGYKDLIEAGPFAIQPGLKSRFMYQFECTPYNAEQLFLIFKSQLKKKGWTLTDEEATLKLFEQNHKVFLGFGRDTERAAHFSAVAHSCDYTANENIPLNMINPSQVQRGILELKENNFSTTSSESNNPLANMMKMMSNKNEIYNYAQR